MSRYDTSPWGSPGAPEPGAFAWAREFGVDPDARPDGSPSVVELRELDAGERIMPGDVRWVGRVTRVYRRGGEVVGPGSGVFRRPHLPRTPVEVPCSKPKA